MIAAALRTAGQSDGMVIDGNLRLGARVDLVGFFLTVGVDPFTNVDVDLIVGRGGQIYRSAIIYDVKARARREGVEVRRLRRRGRR